MPPLVLHDEPEKEPVSVGLSMVKNLESHILFEDNDLIVLNKPTGMAVHGGSGLSFGMIEALRGRAYNPSLAIFARRCYAS